MRIELRERQAGDLRRWLACVGAFLLIGAGLAWLHRCGVQVCLFHRLTGLPCLTCGASRALASVLSGDLAGAVRLQPLVVVGGALAAAGCGAYAAVLLVGRRVARVRLEGAEARVFWCALAALAVLNWLYLVRCGV